MPPPVLGIDFGTTNTAACTLDAQGRVVPVPVTEHSHVMPSVVWYGGQSDHKVVGHLAKKQIVEEPHNTIFGFKRFLGLAFDSAFVQQNRGRFLYQLVEGGDRAAAFRAHETTRSLVEVAATVIGSILERATAHLGQRPERCVLTVPAHFGFGQRAGIRKAALAAGIEVAAVVNEPTAAAVYFARKQKLEGRVLVFDLGGGTFDASLIHVTRPGGRTRIQVVATGGDAFLGGADFDRALVQAVVKRFLDDTGVDLTTERVVMQRLTFVAEQAKIDLTDAETARVRVPFVTMRDERFLDLDYEVNRRFLEETCSGLMDRCLDITRAILARAGVAPADLAEVVLVGGQTRSTFVRERLRDVVGRGLHTGVHPELGVAAGAALLGRDLDQLEDVVPLSIGVMTPALGARDVIGVNAPLPCTGRVRLPARPPPGAPLPVGLYEASGPGAPRENLGIVKVPPEVLSAHPDTPVDLHLTLGRDATLEVTAVLGEHHHPLTLDVLPRSVVVRPDVTVDDFEVAIDVDEPA